MVAPPQGDRTCPEQVNCPCARILLRKILVTAHPRRLAVWLAKRVVRTPWGIGLGIPETMEMALREVGAPRVLLASAVAAVTVETYCDQPGTVLP